MEYLRYSSGRFLKHSSYTSSVFKPSRRESIKPNHSISIQKTDAFFITTLNSRCYSILDFAAWKFSAWRGILYACCLLNALMLSKWHGDAIIFRKCHYLSVNKSLNSLIAFQSISCRTNLSLLDTKCGVHRTFNEVDLVRIFKRFIMYAKYIFCSVSHSLF